jgi:prefoldin subunit 5
LKEQLQAEIRRKAAPANGAGTSAAAASTTAAEHDRLLSQLNQLHILQESNSMLREENNKYVARLKELQSTIDRLESSVNPLTQRIDELESAKSTLESDLAATRLENSRWSGRYQKLLTQSDFIDPEIYKQLREEHDTLQTQKAAIEAELAALKEAHEAMTAERDQIQARLEKMRKAAAHWFVHAGAQTTAPIGHAAVQLYHDARLTVFLFLLVVFVSCCVGRRSMRRPRRTSNPSPRRSRSSRSNRPLSNSRTRVSARSHKPRNKVSRGHVHGLAWRWIRS